MTSTTSTSSSTGTRHLLPREERQAQILRAAATAFAVEGFAATSMEDVAAAAGVTKLIVYRHFESKEDLYRAVLTQVAGRLHDEFLVENAAPERRVKGFTTRAMLTVARENPDGFRLLIVHAAREPQFAETNRMIQLAAFGIASDLIGDRIADPVKKEWASRTCVEYLHAGVLEWLEVGDPARDDEFIELATDGLIGMFHAWVDEPDKL